ncbi:TPA: hypothetical protein QDZ34_003907 [Stenotrophomonas maltophilia]|uniref:hypothetical protein n=1 Tax=Stenotrophomonas TaxID=40323 RepID=UPI0028AF9A2C|nr:hypothetical protein [Stenotrophomonas sp.]HDS0951224.1 hypothetical protein [Stenotrophomonas maltophilia]HDS1027587.1 hypothetical protein [Stenotrophomonas maltophilia]HDS1032096.1 hypothetical protein [Stenotrophomonas maltophilia]HDS1036510.1 hypothetical protein [Stenotrophomonas maltophilia]HDS1039152.1 hypothetical protein [Stenotrophomonas maltophilia]
MEGLAPSPTASSTRSLALSASPDELAWIAALCDAGDDAPRHLAQLQALQHQGGRLSETQEWYPFEVIERGASQLQLGHEREFVICVLLWLQALAQGRASVLDPHLHLDDRAMDIEALPDALRDAVLDAFMAAGY